MRQANYVPLAFSSVTPPLQYNLMGDTGSSNAGVIGYDDPDRESLCCYHDNYTQLSGNSPVSPPDIMSDVVWRDYQYLFYTCPHVVRWQREPFLRELAGIGLLQQLLHALNILHVPNIMERD